MRNPKLKPWFDEALKKVAESGLSGLNISEIAAKINIAKSSFYHYFNTKEEFLDQLLEYWEEEGTTRIIKNSLLRPEQDRAIYNLIDLVFDNNFMHECVLQHLRLSMSENPMIAKRVNEAEKLRISYLSTLLNKNGMTGEESLKRANQIYAFFLGKLSMCNLKAPDKKERAKIMEDFVLVFGEI